MICLPHNSLNNDEDERKLSDTFNQLMLIGYGVFNSESMYRVRILCHETVHPGLAKEVRLMRKLAQLGKSDEGTDINSMNLQLILEKKISDAIYNLSSMITWPYLILLLKLTTLSMDKGMVCHDWQSMYWVYQLPSLHHPLLGA